MPPKRAKRSSAGSALPWLKMMTPAAPAAAALSALIRKVQVPRWIRAMLPGTNPAKSEAWQPLAELGVGVAGTTMPPAGCSFAVAEPATGPGLNSVPSPNDCGVGESSCITGVPTKLK